MKPATYLGDGVYAQMDNTDPTMVVLSTPSHILSDCSNTIYLEPDVVRSLLSWLKLPND